jgi:hypothetical protein
MTQLDEFRLMKDGYFKQELESPLTPEQRQIFSGLEYFPENLALWLGGQRPFRQESSDEPPGNQEHTRRPIRR